MAVRIPMTVAGEAALKAELQDLKSVQRPKVIAAIAEAREHGDLKENAEYHAAREQQSFIEGRIQELEVKLGNAQVIDIANMTNSGKVVFGATVTLINIDSDEEITYQIVGEDEADIKYNKISLSSPLARGLIGKEEGDEANIATPSGVVDYEIVTVEYR
ncbi:transcription elongation factor GreA [Cysteiniphilum sp. QT6929]|uniref:transcription elongation factor GreA n=1 Tax=Cysteiniphilum sp. QT6929 TaxID=2975055 RepID=UPI0024B38197|nr:transcription elongation factor GreA [Cysteiniphilum sp. QT6929]WHN66009.1 transcription elongation factor GreA [Cysteiniphilum sp. QT6929]